MPPRLSLKLGRFRVLLLYRQTAPRLPVCRITATAMYAHVSKSGSYLCIAVSARERHLFISPISQKRDSSTLGYHSLPLFLRFRQQFVESRAGGSTTPSRHLVKLLGTPDDHSATHDKVVDDAKRISPTTTLGVLLLYPCCGGCGTRVSEGSGFK